MTTRQRLNRRTMAAVYTMIVVAFVLGISNAYVEAGSDLDISLRTGGFVIAAALFGWRWLTPCVKCHQAVEWLGLFWTPQNYRSTSPPCPHCGTSIDKDVPGARGF